MRNGLSTWSPEKALAVALATTVVLSLVFWIFPSLDIAVSRLVYTPGLGFPGQRSPVLVLILRLGRAAGWVVGAVLLGVAILKIVRPALLAPNIWPMWWITLGSLALGPGLLVNGILKAWMGRPRPIQTTLFGGTADFVPVWTYSTGCTANCSFVSGEASFGFFLLVFAFWFTGRARFVAFAALGLFGLLVSLNRIVFGGHFLSDVVLSWSMTAAVIFAISVAINRKYYLKLLSHLSAHSR